MSEGTILPPMLPGVVTRTRIGVRGGLCTLQSLPDSSHTERFSQILATDGKLRQFIQDLAEHKLDTVGELQLLAAQLQQNYHHCVAFVKADGLPMLDKLLHCDNLNVQLKALLVLQVLSRTPVVSDVASDAQLVGSLLLLVCSPKHQGKRSTVAIDTICMLAGCKVLFHDNSLQPNLDLWSGSAPVPLDEVLSLPAWSYTTKTELPWIAEAVAHLLEMLPKGELGAVKCRIAKAIKRLMSFRAAGTCRLADKELYDDLVGLVYALHAHMQHAVYVLVSLCILHPDNLKACLDAHFVDALGFAASCDTTGGIMGQACAWALAYLASSSQQATEAIATSEAAASLIALLHSPDANTRLGAVEAVNALVWWTGPDMQRVHAKLLDGNLVPGMLHALQAAGYAQHAGELQLALLRSFWLLRKLPQFRQELRAAGALPMLQELTAAPTTRPHTARLCLRLLQAVQTEPTKVASLVRGIKQQVRPRKRRHAPQWHSGVGRLGHTEDDKEWCGSHMPCVYLGDAKKVSVDDAAADLQRDLATTKVVVQDAGGRRETEKLVDQARRMVVGRAKKKVADLAKKVAAMDMVRIEAGTGSDAVEKRTCVDSDCHGMLGSLKLAGWRLRPPQLHKPKTFTKTACADLQEQCRSITGSFTSLNPCRYPSIPEDHQFVDKQPVPTKSSLSFSHGMSAPAPPTRRLKHSPHTGNRLLKISRRVKLLHRATFLAAPSAKAPLLAEGVEKTSGSFSSIASTSTLKDEIASEIEEACLGSAPGTPAHDVAGGAVGRATSRGHDGAPGPPAHDVAGGAFGRAAGSGHDGAPGAPAHDAAGGAFGRVAGSGHDGALNTPTHDTEGAAISRAADRGHDGAPGTPAGRTEGSAFVTAPGTPTCCTEGSTCDNVPGTAVSSTPGRMPAHVLGTFTSTPATLGARNLAHLSALLHALPYPVPELPASHLSPVLLLGDSVPCSPPQRLRQDCSACLSPARHQQQNSPRTMLNPQILNPSHTFASTTLFSKSTQATKASLLDASALDSDFLPTSPAAAARAFETQCSGITSVDSFHNSQFSTASSIPYIPDSDTCDEDQSPHAATAVPPHFSSCIAPYHPDSAHYCISGPFSFTPHFQSNSTYFRTNNPPHPDSATIHNHALHCSTKTFCQPYSACFSSSSSSACHLDRTVMNPQALQGSASTSGKPDSGPFSISSSPSNPDTAAIEYHTAQQSSLGTSCQLDSERVSSSSSPHCPYSAPSRKHSPQCNPMTSCQPDAALQNCHAIQFSPSISVDPACNFYSMYFSSKGTHATDTTHTSSSNSPYHPDEVQCHTACQCSPKTSCPPDTARFSSSSSPCYPDSTRCTSAHSFFSLDPTLYHPEPGLFALLSPTSIPASNAGSSPLAPGGEVYNPTKVEAEQAVSELCGDATAQGLQQVCGSHSQPEQVAAGQVLSPCLHPAAAFQTQPWSCLPPLPPGPAKPGPTSMPAVLSRQCSASSLLHQHQDCPEDGIGSLASLAPRQHSTGSLLTLAQDCAANLVSLVPSQQQDASDCALQQDASDSALPTTNTVQHGATLCQSVSLVQRGMAGPPTVCTEAYSQQLDMLWIGQDPFLALAGGSWSNAHKQLMTAGGVAYDGLQDWEDRVGDKLDTGGKNGVLRKFLDLYSCGSAQNSYEVLL